MEDYEIIERRLLDILTILNPTREDREIRNLDINGLRGVISSSQSLQGAIVEPCGSFLSNLFCRWGDVSVSVELLNGSHIFFRSKKNKQTLVEEILKALSQNGGWRGLELIRHSKGVPAIKCQSNRSNVCYDISIDNLQEIMKSRFLFRINEIDGRFRDMVLLVKEWAKAHRIYNPRCGALNSYCLVLLVIFHFQTCEPPIFPPFEEIYTGNLGFDLRGERDDIVKSISEEFDASIARFVSNGSRRINTSSLSELLISFFAKFLDLSSKASHLGISIYNGQWEDIGSNPAWSPKSYSILIEDPFERPENSARCIIPIRFKQISEAFQTTYDKLVAAQQSKVSILEVLTTEHTAYCVMQYDRGHTYGHLSTRAPSINHNYFGVSQGHNDLAKRGSRIIYHESRDVGRTTITNSSYNDPISGSSYHFRTRALQIGSFMQQSSGQHPGQGDKAERNSENPPTIRKNVSSSLGKVKQVWRPKGDKGKQV